VVRDDVADAAVSSLDWLRRGTTGTIAAIGHMLDQIIDRVDVPGVAHDGGQSISGKCFANAAAVASMAYSAFRSKAEQNMMSA
jgi:hypothetical protein